MLDVCKLVNIIKTFFNIKREKHIMTENIITDAEDNIEMNPIEIFQYNVQKLLFDHVGELIKATPEINLIDISNEMGIAIGCNLYNALSYSGFTTEENQKLFDDCIASVKSMAENIYTRLITKDPSIKHIQE